MIHVSKVMQDGQIISASWTEEFHEVLSKHPRLKVEDEGLDKEDYEEIDRLMEKDE